MKTMSRRVVIGLIAATTAGTAGLSGCARSDEEARHEDGAAVPGVGNGGDAVDGTEGSPTSSGAPVCLAADAYVARGEIDVRSESGSGESSSGAAASGVGALRWHGYEGCERLVIDLLDAGGGEALRVGEVTAEVLRALGVVRVALLEVERVEPAATEATFGGPLARAAYSVISPEGRGVFVDVHLGEAAEASVVTLSDPARLVVDLRPGGGPVPDRAVSSNRVVMLRPRPGGAAYPLTVTGYARTFEANVVVRLEKDGEDVYQDFTTATSWADAWGHYTFTIPDGPTGRVTLHVGEHSARDGSWEGVELPLDIR